MSCSIHELYFVLELHQSLLIAVHEKGAVDDRPLGNFPWNMFVYLVKVLNLNLKLASMNAANKIEQCVISHKGHNHTWSLSLFLYGM